MFTAGCVGQKQNKLDSIIGWNQTFAGMQKFEPFQQLYVVDFQVPSSKDSTMADKVT